MPSKQIHPYLCFGFVIQDAVVYISDVSHIPEDVWALLQSTWKVPPVLVLDCLRVQKHTSHLSVSESLEVARRMDAQRTYLLGFSHEMSHDDYVAVGEAAGGKELSETELALLKQRDLECAYKGRQIWVRPAFDGLRVCVSDDGTVRDESYA